MHSILHIGAGEANELPQFLETGAEQIVLVEPNPELAEQLRKRTALHPQVTIVEAAITTSSANNQLQEYNLPEACSLHLATGLKTLFPGLRVNATHTVATLSPDQLLAEHGPQSGQSALLAIQAPGEEHELLQALINTDQLKQFSELRVNANPKPYYQGSVAAEKTLQALVDYGYQITDENQQDLDWPSWQLVRNPLKNQISNLLAENEKLKTSTKQLEEALKQNQQQKVHADNQLEQRQSEATRQQSELEEKNAQIKVLNASTQQHEQKLKQSLQANAEAEKQQAVHQQQLVEKREQLNGLLKNVEKLKTDAVEQKKELGQTKSQLDETAKHLEKASKSMAEAQSAYQKSTEALAKEQADHELTNSALEEKNQQILSREPQVEKLQTELERLKLSTVQLTDESEGYKQQAEKQQTELIELKKQNVQLKQKSERESDKISEITNELASGNKKLAAQQATNTRLDDLEKKISSVGNNLTNHLDKKLINAAKQIESTLSLQNYFNTGELPVTHHGWSISPDLAMFLTEKLETENYDLIIEFGSGTSTVLFAKVLMKKMLKQQQRDVLENRRLVNSNATPSSQEWLDGTAIPSDIDLHKRVFTFEHNMHYQEQTAAMLRQSGLERVVNLVHAPMVDYRYQGEDYLYYDCDPELARIAKLYEGKSPRILVLVDGPPGPTGPNARFPAVPKIINALSNAKLEIIMDDYVREEEKEIFKNWKAILSKRGAEFSEIILNFEKGACVLKIG